MMNTIFTKEELSLTCQVVDLIKNASEKKPFYVTLRSINSSMVVNEKRFRRWYPSGTDYPSTLEEIELYAKRNAIYEDFYKTLLEAKNGKVDHVHIVDVCSDKITHLNPRLEVVEPS